MKSFISVKIYFFHAANKNRRLNIFGEDSLYQRVSSIDLFSSLVCVSIETKVINEYFRMNVKWFYSSLFYLLIFFKLFKVYNQQNQFFKIFFLLLEGF